VRSYCKDRHAAAMAVEQTVDETQTASSPVR
jgi:hypothetical protein